MSAKFERDFLAAHPTPPDSPISALRHVVEIYQAKEDDTQLAITATSGMYGDNVTTGLTWGDLASLLARINDTIAVADEYDAMERNFPTGDVVAKFRAALLGEV